MKVEVNNPIGLKSVIVEQLSFGFSCTIFYSDFEARLYHLDAKYDDDDYDDKDDKDDENAKFIGREILISTKEGGPITSITIYGENEFENILLEESYILAYDNMFNIDTIYLISAPILEESEVVFRQDF